ncbi:MAG: 1-deoxy-D-xylulose-5-phosphate reductoisomerase [bacterium]|nr:1-deoxy-D-xylulose-5-phosphate reductoisomerase [bacterium]
MNNEIQPKKLVVLGATGSIGQSTLALARSYPERFKISAITANKSTKQLLRDSLEFQPDFVHLMDENIATGSESEFALHNVSLYSGLNDLLSYLRNCDADIVVAGMVGNVGLMPVFSSLQAGLKVALANKETLVSAGHLVKGLVNDNPGAEIIPVDSEHSAIFQCLQSKHQSFKKLILTASGGRFLNSTLHEMNEATVEEALKHPNWEMGAKITIDSSTLMNKGLEVIEARWLFNCEVNAIDVVVHPQSIIHSMVEFEDSSVLAQLGWPDMTIPIHYALTHPQRMPLESLPSLDLVKIGQLSFEAPDIKRFPCLKLAYEASRNGHSYPAVLNASNEVAVEAFLEGKINFSGIPRTIEWCLEKHKVIKEPTVMDVLEVDRLSRKLCRQYIAGASRSTH